jgi:hypothetical protein
LLFDELGNVSTDIKEIKKSLLQPRLPHPGQLNNFVILFFEHCNIMTQPIDLAATSLRSVSGEIIKANTLWASNPVLVVCLRRPGCCKFCVALILCSGQRNFILAAFLAGELLNLIFVDLVSARLLLFQTLILTALSFYRSCSIMP